MKTMNVLKLAIIAAVLVSSFESYSCFNEDLPCPMYPVYAQTASSSSSLKDKIKELQSGIASRAAQLKQDVNKKLQNKVYVGVIQSKTSSGLVLATRSGNKNVTLNEYTDYEGDRKVSATTLAENDYVAALGDVDDNDVLTAKRIVRMPAPSDTDRQTVAGLVTNLNKPTISIKTYTGQTMDITTDKNTTYKFNQDDAYFDAIKTNKAIIAVISKKVARFVYIVPYAVSIPKAQTATSSGSPSPSSTKNP